MDFLNLKKFLTIPTKEELIQKAQDKVNEKNIQNGAPIVKSGLSGSSSDSSSVKTALRMMFVGALIGFCLYGLLVWFFYNYIFVINPQVKCNYQTLFLIIAWMYFIFTGLSELGIGLMTLMALAAAI